MNPPTAPGDAIDGDATDGDEPDGERHDTTPGDGTNLPTRHRRGMFWARSIGAAAAGAVLPLGFAPTNWWPAAVISATALTLLLWRQRTLAAAALGVIYGMTVAAIAGRYFSSAGIDTWTAMTIAASVFFIPQTVATVWLMRLRAWPLLVPFTWTLQELPQATAIFDGFPWIRLGLTQIDAPWNGIYALGGIPLASVTVGFIAAGAAAAIIAVTRKNPSDTWPTWNAKLAIAWALVAPAVAWTAGYTALAAAPESNGTTTVAVIQGNIDRSERANREWYLDVTQAHAAATTAMWQQVTDGNIERPDVIIWPENSLDFAPDEAVDIDTLGTAVDTAVTVDSDTPTGDILTELTRTIDVPLVIGYSQRIPPRNGQPAAQTQEPLYNRMQLWTAQGGGEYYNKRSLFTFGEYVPWRPLFERIIGPERLTYQVDLTHGTEPGTITYLQDDSDGQTRPVTMGVAICFEIGVDFVARESIAAGGQYLVLGTNSYTWRNTNAPEQQFTAARIRAIETNRAVVVSGVTGPSGIITRNGTPAVKTQADTPVWFVADAELTNGNTPAVIWGEQLELAMFVLAAAAAATAALRTRQRHRHRHDTEQP